MIAGGTRLYSKGRRIQVMISICISIMLLSGCGKKNQEQKAVKESKVHVEKEEKEESQELSKEVKELVEAIQETSKLGAFDLHTTANITLKGTTIQGTYQQQSNIQVIRDVINDDIQMTMESTTNTDDSTSYAYYKEGWYYTDDKNGKTKVQKTTAEVMGSITDISNLVTEEASFIEHMQVTKDAENWVYTYHIPDYKVEQYLEKFTQSGAVNDTELSGSKAEVEQLKLCSTINPKGFLIKQEMTAIGTIKKSIFKVPVEATIIAEFYNSDKTELIMPEFSVY